jgi:hypothetical protein
MGMSMHNLLRVSSNSNTPGAQNASMEFMNLNLPSMDSMDMKRSSASSLADLVRSSSFLTDGNTPTLAVQQTTMTFESEQERAVFDFHTYGSNARRVSAEDGLMGYGRETIPLQPPSPARKVAAVAPPSSPCAESNAVVAGLAKVGPRNAYWNC